MHRTYSVAAAIVASLLAPAVKAQVLSNSPSGYSTETSDTASVELGVKFKAKVAGTVTGIRFFRAASASGNFSVSLWNAAGTKIASGSVGGSVSGAGYVTVKFASPVAVDTNQVYTASYHAPNGKYSFITGGLASAIQNSNLILLAGSSNGGNGVYAYNANVVKPSSTYKNTNYLVDVLFSAGASAPTTPSTPTTPSQPVSAQSALPNSPTGMSVATNDTASVELGVKFQANADGNILGVRFYRANGSGQNFTASLFDANGTKLASGTAAAGTLPGYVVVNFASPVAISANTMYVASYHAPAGAYSFVENGFNNAITSANLTLFADAPSGGNGVYSYSSSVVMPTSSYNASNYMVDVLYQKTGAVVVPAPQPSTPDTPVPSTPTNGQFNLGDRPFAASSSWNTPISSTAKYTAITWPKATYPYSVHWEGYTPSVYVAADSDPLVSVSYPAGWGYPGGTLKVRMPKGISGAVGTDAELVVIEGNKIHNFWGFNRINDTSASASSYGVADAITGTGWGSKNPFLSAGIVAAGSSEFAGLITQAETDRGEIEHALQLLLEFKDSSPGFKGDAIAGDGGSSTGVSQEGQRFAIPKTATMPAGMSPLGQKVFRALQKYGCFHIDVSGDTAFRAQTNAYNQSTIDALRNDIPKFFKMLQKVD